MLSKYKYFQNVIKTILFLNTLFKLLIISVVVRSAFLSRILLHCLIYLLSLSTNILYSNTQMVNILCFFAVLCVFSIMSGNNFPKSLFLRQRCVLHLPVCRQSSVAGICLHDCAQEQCLPLHIFLTLQFPFLILIPILLH